MSIEETGQNALARGLGWSSVGLGVSRAIEESEIDPSVVITTGCRSSRRRSATRCS